MTILLTGAAGFIGSHVAERLLADGHFVIGIDDFNDYYDPRFKRESIQSCLTNARFTLYEMDICDAKNLEQVFSTHTIDSIIHLAARAGVRSSITQPLLYEQTNIHGTYALLEQARLAKVQEFIFASSSSLYGNQTKIPFSETDPITQPISPYAATKAADELIAYTYHHLYHMNCVGLRFFTVYGERGRPDMAPYQFVNAILQQQPIRRYGNGSAERGFTYITDIVNGIVACVQKNLGYEIINLGHPQSITINEFIALIERISGKQAVIDEQPSQPGEVRKTCADITKAQRLLDWNPTTSLENGLSNFISWFEQHRLNR